RRRGTSWPSPCITSGMRSRNEPASPRRRGPAVLLTAGALGLALLIPATGEAAPPPAAERVRELEQIRGEIAGLQARLDQMRVRERSLDDELATLDVDLDLREQRIAVAIPAQERLGG